MPEHEPVAEPADCVLRIAENVVYPLGGVLLSGVSFLLAVSGFLVRRKERAPEEEDEADAR